ncbi:MAG: bi-domain-containing oxidoreductase [Cyanobacteriota bacterium]
MKQVLIKQGQAIVTDVPAPMVEPGTILVRVERSCISTGTEMSGLQVSRQPLWQRAIRNPDKVKKVVEMALNQGVQRAATTVQGKLESGSPPGYSAAGTVIAGGEGVEEIQAGDRVACAGAQCAHHAEVIRVPPNLCVAIPDPVDFDLASTVTLGAIALQGVRRAQPTMGEVFVVLGLGVLGQITAQLLSVNGCRTIGTDLDRGRIQQAEELGMALAIHPEDGDAIQRVFRLTDGLGADGVIITAATSSDEVISQAFQMCRKKGRVVLVGDVGLNLNRADFYQKELDFFISTSYGPGRYDRRYEEEGMEYPAAYIRWTENRNMGEYLRLIGEGKLKIKPLISEVYPVTAATGAYEAIRASQTKPMLVLLSYPNQGEPERVIANPSLIPQKYTGQSRVAMVGAGDFAKGMHLPNLQGLSDRFTLRAVASRTGANAEAVARQFGAAYSTTDYEKVLADPEVDLLFICTRHDLHAPMTLQGLRAGKHVFVEKPLALTAEELAEIQGFYDRDLSNGPLMLTGFNRRFSPVIAPLYQQLADRSNPLILNYRMNAGYIPLDSWVHGATGGGRNLGEACHIYDLFTALVGAKATKVEAQALRPTTGYYSGRDNFVATISFEDGSVATLTYTALGSRDYPKEHLEVYGEGKVWVMEDYKSLRVFGSSAKGIDLPLTDKGHKQELLSLEQAIKLGGGWPIPLWQQVQATEIALAVEQDLLEG